jgi:hypothetical protein
MTHSLEQRGIQFMITSSPDGEHISIGQQRDLAERINFKQRVIA